MKMPRLFLLPILLSTALLRCGAGDPVSTQDLSKALVGGTAAERRAALQAVLASIAERHDEFAGPEISNALCKLLADENTDLRRGAALALEKSGAGTPEVIAALTTVASDKDPGAKAAAISALGALADPARSQAAVALILGALDDPLPQLRVTALDALHRRGPPPQNALPALLAMTAKEKHPDVLNALAACLAAADPIPAEAAGFLVTALHGRKTLAETLNKMGPKASPALVPLLKSDSQYLRREAAAFFEKFPPDDSATIDLLAEKMKDSDATVRRSATNSLIQLGPRAKTAVTRLIPYLGDADPQLRSAAASVLESVAAGGVTAVPALLLLMQDKTLACRTAAGKALGKMGPKALAGMLELLKSPRDEVRAAASSALPAFGDSAIPGLALLLKSESDSTLLAALAALDKMGGAREDAVPPTVALLKNAKPALRQAAAQALRRGAGRSLKPLLAVISLDEEYLPEAKSALTDTLAQSSGVSALIEFVDSRSDGPAQTLVIEALGKCGPAAADAVSLLTSKLVLCPAPINPLLPAPSKKTLASAATAAPALPPYAKLDAAVLRALAAIGKSAAPALPMVFELLKDGESSVRSEAARCIGRILLGNERVPPLSETIERCDIGNLAQALRPFEQRGIDALLEESTGAGSVQRHRIVSTLTNLPPPDVTPAMVRALKNEDAHIRGVAAEVLGELRHISRKAAARPPPPAAAEEVSAALKALLADPDPDVRVLAAWACIPAIDPKDAASLSALANGLAKCAPEFRNRGLVALDHFDLGSTGRAVAPALPVLLRCVGVEGAPAPPPKTLLDRIRFTPEDVPVLIEAARDKSKAICRYAVAALTALGPQAKDAIPALIDVLAEQDKSCARDAIAVLVAIGDDSAPPLIDALKSASAPRRLGAGHALAQLKLDGERLDSIAELLGDTNPEIRGAALAVLSVTSERSRYALPRLGDLLADEDKTVVRALPELMASLGTEASTALIQALKDPRPHVRAHAALSLRPGGNMPLLPEAYEPLKAVLKDDSPEAKVAALLTLTSFADEKGEIVALLPAVMEDETALVRRAVLTYLKGHAKANPPAALAALEIAAKDPLPHTRLTALTILRTLGLQTGGGPLVVKPLYAALADDDRKVRSEAAAILDELGLITNSEERGKVDEMMVRDALDAYAHAQEDYFIRTWDEHKIHYYASNLKDLELGAMAAAGSNAPKPAAYFGYWFVMLEGQTAQAPGGAKTYRVDERLMHGHALLAYPAKYGATGRLTFAIADDGTLFTKNLGSETAKLAAEIRLLDPDETWTRGKIKPREEPNPRFHTLDPEAIPLEF